MSSRWNRRRLERGSACAAQRATDPKEGECANGDHEAEALAVGERSQRVLHERDFPFVTLRTVENPRF